MHPVLIELATILTSSEYWFPVLGMAVMASPLVYAFIQEPYQ